MKNKIQQAITDMMSKIDIKKAGTGHYYVGKAAPVVGKKIAGVTSITKNLSGFTSDIAAMYGAKQMSLAMGDYEEYEGELPDLSYTEEVLKEIKAIDKTEDYIKLIRGAKKRHKEHSKEALDVGTEGHSCVEKYILSRIRDEEPIEGYIGQEWIDKALSEFYEWAKPVKFYLSEARVCMLEPYSTETIIQNKRVPQTFHTEYAGTMDILAEIDGKLTVIDLKFANQVSQEYQAQLSAYAKTFEPYGIEVKDRMIVRFPKTEFLKEYVGYGKHKKVKNELEIVSFSPETLEHDFGAFLCEREVYRWRNAQIKK